MSMYYLVFLNDTSYRKKMKAEKESRDSFSDEINIILHAYSGQGLRQIPGMQCGRII